MNFNDLKNNALTKNQMRAIKGGGLNGNGTCGAIRPQAQESAMYQNQQH